MLNETQINKVERFMNDPVMSSAVREVLLNSFLRSKPLNNDVNMLAAARIAIDLLEDGWRDLNKYKNSVGEGEKPTPVRGF